MHACPALTPARVDSERLADNRCAPTDFIMRDRWCSRLQRAGVSAVAQTVSPFLGLCEKTHNLIAVVADDGH